MRKGSEIEHTPIVEDIYDGYSGSEASVIVQLRNIFPGIGGTIKTEQPVVTALRKPFSHHPETGNKLYLKHLIIKKLDDYFCKIGKYKFPHISRPLGSLGVKTDGQEASIYEWVFGAETFPWEYRTEKGRHPIVLTEWNAFADAFENTGIRMGIDITDPDNGRVSQNIIHELCRFDSSGSNLNQCWKRIDFGSRSLPFNQERLATFLEKNKDLIIGTLSKSRYRLLLLAFKSLFESSSITEPDMKELSVLCRNYRLSSLRHAVANIITS